MTLDVGQSTMQRTGTLPLEASSGETRTKDHYRAVLHVLMLWIKFFTEVHVSLARVYHMKPTGFEVISEQDCKELHYMYADEKKK